MVREWAPTISQARRSMCARFNENKYLKYIYLYEELTFQQRTYPEFMMNSGKRGLKECNIKAWICCNPTGCAYTMR